MNLLTFLIGYKHYFCVMKLWKVVFNFYINASIHVALAVYAFVRITELYLGLRYNENLDCFIFFGTITGYNFIKYAGIAKLYHRSLTENLKIIQVFSLVCFLVTLFYASKLSLQTLLFFIPLGLITLLYAIPFLSGFSKNLRNIGSLKIFVISIVWALTTVLLPVIDIQKSIDLNLTLKIIQRMLFVIVLTIPFDIRDLKFDHRKLQTLPQVLGVERVKKLGFILLGFTVVLEFFFTPNMSFKSVYLVVFLLSLILLQRAKRKQTKYYASFLVEAVPIIWLLLLFVFVKE